MKVLETTHGVGNSFGSTEADVAPRFEQYRTTACEDGADHAPTEREENVKHMQTLIRRKFKDTRGASCLCMYSQHFLQKPTDLLMSTLEPVAMRWPKRDNY